MKNYEFWFVVGSQTLYGEEVLRTVAARAEEMAQKLSAVSCLRNDPANSAHIPRGTPMYFIFRLQSRS